MTPEKSSLPAYDKLKDIRVLKYVVLYTKNCSLWIVIRIMWNANTWVNFNTLNTIRFYTVLSNKVIQSTICENANVKYHWVCVSILLVLMWYITCIAIESDCLWECFENKCICKWTKTYLQSFKLIIASWFWIQISDWMWLSIINIRSYSLCWLLWLSK